MEMYGEETEEYKEAEMDLEERGWIEQANWFRLWFWRTKKESWRFRINEEMESKWRNRKARRNWKPTAKIQEEKQNDLGAEFLERVGNGGDQNQIQTQQETNDENLRNIESGGAK